MFHFNNMEISAERDWPMPYALFINPSISSCQCHILDFTALIINRNAKISGSLSLISIIHFRNRHKDILFETRTR